MNNTPRDIEQIVSLSLSEDMGNGDITANLIPISTIGKASVICREQAVIAGIPWFNEVFKQVDPTIHVKWLVNDGDFVSENSCLCHIEGKARNILSAERCALNFLQTLSATATRTKTFVDRISHTKTKILDTRKTIPGLRDAQKYAVVCGGGKNHRKGLYDGILIKENHIMAAGSVQNAVENAKTLKSQFEIEVEVETLDELKQAINAGANIALLDNMDIDTLNKAVSLTHGQIKLEASGGITLKNVRAIAETGVDFISIGDLTKNIQAIDLSMRFQN